jgi:predicted permease
MADFRADVARRLAGLDLDPARRVDIVEELAQHLSDCHDAALARGLDAAAARDAALAELSDERLLARDLLAAERAAPEPPPAIGSTRRRPLATLWLDVRHAVRALRKNPGYASIALLTLALGIGACTAIFAVVHAVALRQLPYTEPEGLVRIWESNVERDWPQFSASQPNFLDFAERSRTFEHIAAVSSRRLTLTGDGNAELVNARRVSRDFLPALRVVPILGRAFEAAEDTPGGDVRVAILTHGFWQRAFGSDPGVLGRTLMLDGMSHRVIGVMPESFEWGDDVGLLLPLAADSAANRGDHRLSMIGRLAAGATIDDATHELEAIAAQLAREYPETNEGWSVLLRSFRDWLIPQETRQSLVVLAGAVVLLLLIACLNTANLMLARANARRRELAIRAALGADRRRIAGYLMVEALVLAIAAGALGLLIAAASLGPLLAFGADSLPRLEDASIHPLVGAFALGASLLTGLLSGSLAALRVSRMDLQATLRDGTQGSGVEARRLRSALVLAEMALSVALLIGAGLLMRSFWKLQDVEPGFATANLVVASLTLPEAEYGGTATTVRFYERLLADVRALPGVRGVALSSMVPFSGGDTSTGVRVPDHPAADEAKLPSASWRLVSPGYFATLGIPLRGRDFDARDTMDGQRVTIISDAMARRYWPGEDPVGKSVILSSLVDTPIAIVGVAGDVRTFGLDVEPTPMVYVSTLAVPGWNPMQLAVRSALDPEPQVAALREAVRAIDPKIPLFGIETVDGMLSRSLTGRRFNLFLLGCFASAALVLASVGLGGVMAWLVSLRTRELGIRVALGAPARRVFQLVVGQGMRLALAGAMAGVLAALLLSRALQELLFSVSARDPLTFVAVPALLLAVAWVACWWPARRAARVDPNQVLRSD